ncbi:SDR family NAD(P)-dependent oxidoreductase [Thermodesulfobacteriota bacterium]
MSVKDKIALVTGAGQGIGQGIALRFAEAGAKVVVADLSSEGISDTVEKIQSKGGDCLAVNADVSKSSDVKAMVDQTVDKYGTLDILVNNAGIVKTAPIMDLSEEDWDVVMDVDLKGPFLCSKYAAKVMVPNKQGWIINISSVAGHEPNPDVGSYGPAKAGVLMLTKQCAIEWGRYNIRVNSISPGLIRTPINPAYEDSEVRNARSNQIPLGRLGSPEDIAKVAVMLASDETGYVTGCDIQVDGGYLRNFQEFLPGRLSARNLKTGK